MEHFEYVDMPDYFTRLLSVDMSSTSPYFVGLQRYVLDNPSLKGVMDRLFNKGEEIDINSHIKSLGWHGIRDRLLAYYINFAQNREHAVNVSLDCIDDILDMEKKLRFSTVSGYSRMILYGMFLKLLCIEDEVSSIQQHPLYPNKDVIDILNKAKERVINIDYLILHIHHLIKYFGKEKVLAFIQQDFSYESIYLKLKESQIEEMCNNFLIYAASIGDDGLFTEVRV